MPLRPDHKKFPNLSHASFQHPLDRQAIAALEKTPFLPTVLQKLSGATIERLLRIQLVSSYLRVGPTQYPTLYHNYLQLAEALDVRNVPTLYIATNGEINAFATGMKEHYIVVYSGLMELLTEDELLAVIAHELGHVKCNHMLYRTMVNFIMTYGGDALIQSMLPPLAGPLVALGIKSALYEWYRKAEFSCDRAALIATQNEEAVVSLLAKLAGHARVINPEEFNLEAVKDQARDYEDVGADSVIDKIFKVMAMDGQTHPFPVVRAAEISKWAATAEYSNILDGRYAQLSAPGAGSEGGLGLTGVILNADGSYEEGGFKVTPIELAVTEKGSARKYPLETVTGARVDPQVGGSCALRLLTAAGKEVTAAYSRDVDLVHRIADAITQVVALRG